MKFLTFIIISLFSSIVFAWEPKQPIEVISGMTAGSALEMTFRIPAAEIEKNNPKVRFLINNKPGAGGAIASENFIKEPADGYHVMIGSSPALYATDRIAFPNKRHGLGDYTFVMGHAESPMTIITLPTDPANNMKDFVRIAATEKITIGDPGAAARLTFELLNYNLKWNVGPSGIARIEYKGPVDTLNDVMGGHVRYGIMPLGNSYQAHKAGKVKIVAVSSANTLASLPMVSTFSSVIPEFEWKLVWGIVLPKNTPKDVVDWYQREFARALKNPEVIDKLANIQIFVPKNLSTPEKYTDYLYTMESKFKPVVNKVILESIK